MYHFPIFVRALLHALLGSLLFCSLIAKDVVNVLIKFSTTINVFLVFLLSFHVCK